MKTLYDRLSDITRQKVDEFPYPTTRQNLLDELKSKTSVNNLTIDGASTLMCSVLGRPFDLITLYELFN